MKKMRRCHFFSPFDLDNSNNNGDAMEIVDDVNQCEEEEANDQDEKKIEPDRRPSRITRNRRIVMNNPCSGFDVGLETDDDIDDTAASSTSEDEISSSEDQ
mmetsp:Transcript_22499/g.31473  ORF Transcript_22499/g.31473 Transcript_22499/m.31473 type:complete len:101 (+) Transcript_22499:185-487(+)|eukprot:CAMPEP_0184483454 /NCGR_PEP_ID=MMETSP0113_2-20130426/5109_1 /TAXON_ID=91329 /ORGANISM="Norrisiella sphaerica, Strain BC52" /LENGTH=100 /DNA_ID=CAMNT_0026863865 /DNA_START=605 /DNA_END=907 /DNA_ORIENTATION=-